jgi:hypothetical protein
MKRLLGVTAALTLGALALAGTAGATKPFMVRDVQGPLTLSDTCSFPVLLQPTAPDVSNFFIFSDGEIMGSGPFVGTATNLDGGKERRHGHHYFQWLRPLELVRHPLFRAQRHRARRQRKCDLEDVQRDGTRSLRRTFSPITPPRNLRERFGLLRWPVSFCWVSHQASS